MDIGSLTGGGGGGSGSGQQAAAAASSTSGHIFNTSEGSLTTIGVIAVAFGGIFFVLFFAYLVIHGPSRASS
jgi:hypothetical protein